eukprot:gb/GECG01005354.1/.p1 GENE.gb/GECG01005354.1/~~gb/GECG01005354.1/.p1  ORF type:complete len:890 (+),score=102.59 gb/GECG01005354.1/:1-2670(+)
MLSKRLILYRSWLSFQRAPIQSCSTLAVMRITSNTARYNSTRTSAEEQEELDIYMPPRHSFKGGGKQKYGRNQKSLVRLSRDAQQGIAALRKEEAKKRALIGDEWSEKQQRQFARTVREASSMTDVLHLYKMYGRKLDSRNVLACVTALTRNMSRVRGSTGLNILKEWKTDEAYRRMMQRVDKILQHASRKKGAEQLDAATASSLMRSMIVLGEETSERMNSCVEVFRRALKFQKARGGDEIRKRGNALAEFFWILTKLHSRGMLETMNLQHVEKCVNDSLQTAFANNELVPSHCSAILFHACRLAEVLELPVDHVVLTTQVILQNVDELSPVDIAMLLRSFSQHTQVLNEALSSSSEALWNSSQGKFHDHSREAQNRFVTNTSEFIAQELQRRVSHTIDKMSLANIKSVIISLGTIYGHGAASTLDGNPETTESLLRCLSIATEKLSGAVPSFSDMELCQLAFSLVVILGQRFPNDFLELKQVRSAAESLANEILRRGELNPELYRYPDALSVLAYFQKDHSASGLGTGADGDEWIQLASEASDTSVSGENDVISHYLEEAPNYSNEQLRQSIISLSVSPYVNDLEQLSARHQVDNMSSLVFALAEELYTRISKQRSISEEGDLRLESDLDLCALATWLSAVHGRCHTLLGEWTIDFWKHVILWRNEVVLPKERTKDYEDELCTDLVGRSRDNLPAILLQLYQSQLSATLQKDECSKIFLSGQLANAAKSLLIRSEKRRLKHITNKTRMGLHGIHRELDLAARITAPQHQEQLNSTRAIAGYITDTGYVFPLAFPELRVGIDFQDQSTSGVSTNVLSKQLAAKRLRHRLITQENLAPETLSDAMQGSSFPQWDIISVQEDFSKVSKQHLAATAVDQLLVCLNSRLNNQ